MPALGNVNLSLGRYTVNVNPETFLGFIDEVQITTGVVLVHSGLAGLQRLTTTPNKQPYSRDERGELPVERGGGN